MNFCFLTRWNKYRDQIYHSTWTTKWTKCVKHIWNNGLQELGIMQWTIVISETWETNEVTAHSLLAWKVSRMRCRKGEERKSGTLSWGHELRIWKDYAARIPRTEFGRGESCIQRHHPWSVKGSPPELSWVQISSCMWGNHPGLGRQLFERIRRNSAWCSQRAWNSACSHPRQAGTLRFMGTG